MLTSSGAGGAAPPMGGGSVYIVQQSHPAEAFLLALLALLFPPLAVLIDRGCDGQFCLNVLLTLLGYLPGVLHAWAVLFCCPGLTNETFIVAAGPPPVAPHAGVGAPVAGVGAGVPAGAVGVPMAGSGPAAGAGAGAPKQVA
jgi:uncharacterized membrane protein YqaE (UPF0057 family)